MEEQLTVVYNTKFAM